jgi:hypothetical protein
MPGAGNSARTCRLEIVITQDGKATRYRVLPLETELHVRAFELTKDDHTVYHVTQEHSGRKDCECGDRAFRDHPCKHITVLTKLGLLLRPREVQAMRWYEEERKCLSTSGMSHERSGAPTVQPSGSSVPGSRPSTRGRD